MCPGVAYSITMSHSRVCASVHFSKCSPFMAVTSAVTARSSADQSQFLAAVKVSETCLNVT